MTSIRKYCSATFLLLLLQAQYIRLVDEVVARLSTLQVLRRALGAILNENTADTFTEIGAQCVVQDGAFQLRDQRRKQLNVRY